MEVKHSSIELKYVDDKNETEFLSVEGYGSTFGNTDQGGDIVEPGAFKDSIEVGPLPKMLWQHNPSHPIGVWDRVSEDSIGLKMSGRIYKGAGRGEEVAGLVKMGAVSGLSIGYRAIDFETDPKSGARKLKKLDLLETSIVTFPMNTLAGIYAAKSASDMTEHELKRYIEKALKNIKISNTMAKAMAAAAMEKSFDLRDVGRSNLDICQREVDDIKRLLIEITEKTG